jgi:RsiW-degrading membrane proteinase PrsW (M82 family)
MPTSDTLWGMVAGVFPVLAFLGALAALDTFKLVRPTRIAISLACGGVAAVLAYATNSRLAGLLGANSDAYWQFGAPWVEEILKAAWILYLVRAEKVGFMVDSAICGFATGAGFALVENLVYLEEWSVTGLGIWLLRGFGTAVMHGGATAIVGVVAVELRRGERRLAFLSGILLAVAIHTGWDVAILSPLEASMAVLLGLPPLFILLVTRSEESLRDWIGNKLAKDIDLMEMIETGQFLETPSGRYLRSLNALPKSVLGDMLCILQLTSELSAASKGNMIRRMAGLPVEEDPEILEKLQELEFLERSIGIAGRSALAPLLSLSTRDRWELKRLAELKPDWVAVR